jgi:hypothetical protein
MIAHIIPNQKQKGSFGKLARYVVDAIGGIDPATWTRTADYILDTREQGQKVGGVRVTNCMNQDPAAAALEILAVQAMNTRSKTEKYMHIVVSFPEGENPTLEQLHAIEDELCASMGMADHQRISAIHTDTDNLHVHIALSKVHPATLNNITPYYPKKRLMEACERLEIQHGLERTNHGLDASRQNGKTNERDHQQRVELNHHDYLVLRESYRQAIASAQAENTHGVPVLSGGRVVRDHGGSEMLLPGYEDANLVNFGAERPDGMRWPDHGAGRPGGRPGESREQKVILSRDELDELRAAYAVAVNKDPEAASLGAVKSMGQQPIMHAEARDVEPEPIDVRIGGRAADMEAHAGVESFHGWIKRNAGAELVAASTKAESWQDFHDVLATYGLVARPRGAGLVIADDMADVAIKASDVHRSLSMNALAKRWGEFTGDARAAERANDRALSAIEHMQGRIEAGAGAAIAAVVHSDGGWEALHQVIEDQGLSLVMRDGALHITGEHGLDVKTDHVHHSLGAEALQARWGAYRPPGALHDAPGQPVEPDTQPDPRASQEAPRPSERPRQETLEQRIKRTSGPSLVHAADKSKSWQELHDEFAKHGLRIKPRGAGLAIVDEKTGATVRASDIHRSLSMATLTAKWGAYQPDVSRAAPNAKKRYAGEPRHTATGTSALFTAYQRERNAALKARADAKQTLRKEHEKYSADLSAWYARRRDQLKERRDLTGPQKRAESMAMRNERIDDLARRRELEKEQRRKIDEKHPTPTWQAFLQKRAAAGDLDALAALRSKAPADKQRTEHWADAGDDELRHIIFRHLKPEVRKSGDVVYRTKDGARVTDSAKSVRTDRSTDEAVQAALVLAKERFAGQALRVDGDDAFKAAVLRAVIERGMKVTFEDPSMERARLEGLLKKADAEHARSKRGPGSTTGAGADKSAEATENTQKTAAPADKQRSTGQAANANAYVDARNAIHGRMSAITYMHRVWTPADAGKAEYQGRRRFADGTEAVLLRKGDTILVMPATPAQVAKASGWAVGQAVTIDERGRFVGTTQGKAR